MGAIRSRRGGLHAHRYVGVERAPAPSVAASPDRRAAWQGRRGVLGARTRGRARSRRAAARPGRRRRRQCGQGRWWLTSRSWGGGRSAGRALRRARGSAVVVGAGAAGVLDRAGGGEAVRGLVQQRPQQLDGAVREAFRRRRTARRRPAARRRVRRDASARGRSGRAAAFPGRAPSEPAPTVTITGGTSACRRRISATRPRARSPWATLAPPARLDAAVSSSWRDGRLGSGRGPARAAR